ncbi:MAG: NDP-sugar synthase [Armatimonadota bacterium]|nr:NDP-sugar synthase [Armatimonadota bacterium]
MQAVILAGGKGTRLHPLTANIPKPLTPMFNRPVMEHTLELLAKHGIRDVIVTLSHLAHEIVDYFGDGEKLGVDIRYSMEETPKGTAGGVKELQPLLDGTFLVVSGDAVTDFDITAALEFHRRKSAIATLLLHEVDDPSEFGVVSTSPDGQVTRFFEKPKAEEVFSHTVNTGIYILEPEALSCIPYDTPYDFGRELFPHMLRNMEPVFGCKPDGYWCDIGNLAQYRNAHFDALMGKAKLRITGTEIEEGVWVGDDCDVHSTARLTGPVFIGDGAEVRRNVSVGALSVVGDRTLLDEASTVRRSIVGNGAFIGRASRVTDCVIGTGYRVVDHGDVHNRVVTVIGDRMIHSTWDADDVPSIRINGISDVNASPLAA